MHTSPAIYVSISIVFEEGDRMRKLTRAYEAPSTTVLGFPIARLWRRVRT
jgi:hypothetical protein